MRFFKMEKCNFLNPPMSNVQWSKSIVLENKVAINFDFRSGAKKSGHLDYPLQSYGPKIVNMPKYGLNWLKTAISQQALSQLF